MPLIKITSQDLKKMIDNNPSLLIIDVREDHEYQAGHIINAVHKPLSRFLIEDLPKNNEYVFYCRSGYRSGVAAEHLLEHNYHLTVYNLSRGINDWIQSGFFLIQD
jgi:rhodanese-related sulfurtransferase